MAAIHIASLQGMSMTVKAEFPLWLEARCLITCDHAAPIKTNRSSKQNRNGYDSGKRRQASSAGWFWELYLFN